MSLPFSGPGAITWLCRNTPERSRAMRMKSLAVISSMFFLAAAPAAAELVPIYGPVYVSKIKADDNGRHRDGRHDRDGEERERDHQREHGDREHGDGHEKRDKETKITFTAPVAGDGLIIVKNGADQGKKARVGKAEIELNGQEIAKAKDFNKETDTLQYSVKLLSTNELEVEVESCRECKIEITVLGQKPEPTPPTRVPTAPTRAPVQ